MSWVLVAVGASSAFSQMQAGKTARGQSELQAQQSDYQAKIEEASALQTAQMIRRAGRNQVGQANAGYAASGVKVGEGSALETERQIDTDVEHDAFQALLDGDRRARGLRTQGTMDRISGRMQQTAGNINAVGTLLTSGYSAMKSNGWRTAGPGFSGTQAPAPVEDRSTYSAASRNYPKG